MSSPITFSGFNNIDFNVVLNAIMQQASLPLDALQARQASLKSQVTTFTSLTTRLTTLETAAAGLAESGGLTSQRGTSSDPTAVGVSIGAGAVAGHYDVVVNELARAQVTASTSSSPDSSSTVVASGGSITIGGVDVAIAGDVTLQGLADTINGTDGIGVTAAVIRTAPSSYRLVLTASGGGLDNAFTVTNGLGGGTGVTFADTDLDGVSGDSAADNAVNPSDASLLVNNIPVTGSSNTFADVIPGVTLTALKKDPTATIGVDVEPDSTAFRTKVEGFVSAFNDFVKFVNDQRATAVSGDGASIGRDPLLRQLRNSLRSDLLGAHGAGTYTRLSEVGIEFTTAGTIKINDALFSQAVAADGDGVRELFAGAGGVFPSVEALIGNYTAVSGIIPTVKNRLTAQATAMDKQIVSLQSRLAIQRESLQRQFTEADQIMSRLSSQSGALSSFGGLSL